MKAIKRNKLLITPTYSSMNKYFSKLKQLFLLDKDKKDKFLIFASGNCSN